MFAWTWTTLALRSACHAGDYLRDSCPYGSDTGLHLPLQRDHVVCYQTTPHGWVERGEPARRLAPCLLDLQGQEVYPSRPGSEKSTSSRTSWAERPPICSAIMARHTEPTRSTCGADTPRDAISS